MEVRQFIKIIGFLLQHFMDITTYVTKLCLGWILRKVWSRDNELIYQNQQQKPPVEIHYRQAQQQQQQKRLLLRLKEFDREEEARYGILLQEKCPSNYRIIQENYPLMSWLAKARHVYSGCPGGFTSGAIQMSMLRSVDPMIIRNTVVEEPESWNLCMRLSDEEVRVVSSHRVATVHCTKMWDGRWSAEDKGRCFAIFEENGHMCAWETYKTSPRAV